MANLNRSRSVEQKRARQIREVGKKTRYLCIDGPWRGQRIWLSDGGDTRTAVLKIGEQRGYYVHTTRTPSGELAWEVVS